ncbi:hypothetical protein DCC62_09435 [candidate division KSB1 bacterium]|nr:MAG: hypothetical protein DCC62_09435 [candidate division KSB1 bacterium]
MSVDKQNPKPRANISRAEVVALLAQLEEKFLPDIKNISARLEQLEAMLSSPCIPADLDISQALTEFTKRREMVPLEEQFFNPEFLSEEDRELKRNFLEIYWQGQVEWEEARHQMRMRRIKQIQQTWFESKA